MQLYGYQPCVNFLSEHQDVWYSVCVWGGEVDIARFYS